MFSFSSLASAQGQAHARRAWSKPGSRPLGRGAMASTPTPPPLPPPHGPELQASSWCQPGRGADAEPGSRSLAKCLMYFLFRRCWAPWVPLPFQSSPWGLSNSALYFSKSGHYAPFTPKHSRLRLSNHLNNSSPPSQQRLGGVAGRLKTEPGDGWLRRRAERRKLPSSRVPLRPPAAPALGCTSPVIPKTSLPPLSGAAQL